MRTVKMMLLGLGVPLALVLAGVGQTASAQPSAEATPAAPAAAGPIGGINCTIVLCPAGTTCVDKPTGPRCVPLPGPK